MKKYISPTIELVEIETNDIMSVSNGTGVYIAPLEGVDEGDSQSAIFDVGYWLSKF